MEYCENGELFHYIVERQRLSEEESSFFFYQLINGLQYIHSENIVHRDLKPENLLLGKNNILKIIDFGLSNFSEPENYLETPCGSPCYASPEMVSGKKYDGHIIDIWSTGIILFAMLCGYLPFEDQDNDILFKKILKCKIKYPEYLSEISIDLMKKILVREPDKRITLNDIKLHPFYLKGKNIFAKIHHELINEVEKIDNNNKDIKLIKNIKINNINNMITSKDMKDESNYDDILNTSTKNYFYEQNDDYFDYLNKKYKKLSHNLYNKISKKMKKEIKEMNDKNNYKLIEKKPEKKMGHKEIVYNLINAEVGSNDNSSFNLNKLLQDKTMKEKEKKEKLKNNENRPFSTENKNIHQCETGVAINYNIYNYNNNYNNNINYNSDTKNNNTNLSLLQKLLNNNKIILHNNEPKSPSNIKKPEKNKILKGNTLKELFKNYKTEYKINKKLAKSQEHEKSFISKSFKSQTISEKEKARKNKSYNKFTSSINLKKNKIKKEKDKDTFSNNNNKANMKPSLYKEIKYNKHNFNNNININMNINFLSANNNLTNNINIIKSPLKTSRKNENFFSKQYTMKFDLGRLKSKHGNNNTNNTNNTNKNDYSASLSGINLNNLNNFDINRLKNNNMNMNFSYLSNNNISPCNSNMSITSRKNNFFNHKKLLIATLNKKIKSPQQNKLSNYINLSSGDFLKIKKNMISKKHKKNEINFKNNNNNHNFSNIMSNISNSGIINLNKITSNINIRPQNKSTKNKSSKKIPLIGLNINNNKKIKQNNETFSFRKKKEKEKDKKHLSFGKAYININIKEFLSGKMNYKKISNKTKDNIITIKKMNKCISNKSKTKILDKRINSGNRTTVNNNHNNFKFFKGINVLLDGNNMRRDMISGNNNNKILVNSFIKFQKKNANKK